MPSEKKSILRLKSVKENRLLNTVRKQSSIIFLKADIYFWERDGGYVYIQI